LKSLIRLFTAAKWWAPPTTWKACSQLAGAEHAPRRSRFSKRQYGADTTKPSPASSSRMALPGCAARTTIGAPSLPARVTARLPRTR
jgi:hypothetical protein